MQRENGKQKHPKLCNSAKSTDRVAVPTRATVEESRRKHRTHLRKYNITCQTLNRTRVTSCEDNASALNAEAHTDEHLELAVWDDHEFTRDVPELDFQDGA